MGQKEEKQLVCEFLLWTYRGFFLDDFVGFFFFFRDFLLFFCFSMFFIYVQLVAQQGQIDKQVSEFLTTHHAFFLSFWGNFILFFGFIHMYNAQLIIEFGVC